MKLYPVDKFMLGVLVIMAGIILWSTVYADFSYIPPAEHIPHTKENPK